MAVKDMFHCTSGVLALTDLYHGPRGPRLREAYSIALEEP